MKHIFTLLAALLLVPLAASHAAETIPSKPSPGKPPAPSAKVEQPSDPLTRKVMELCNAGKLISGTAFAESLKSPRASKFVALPARTRPLPGREIAELAAKAYVRVGWVFQCTSCNRVHLGFSGGYAIAKDTIVTAYHALKEPKAMKPGTGYPLVVRGDDDVLRVLSVVAADETMDTVIVRVQTDDLHPLPFSTDAHVGDAAYCLSDPGGQRGYFSSGIVDRFYSNDRHSLTSPEHQRMNVSTNWAPGSSGAALLDGCGNIIGHVATVQTLFADKAATGRSGAPPVVMVLHEAIPAKSVLTLLQSSPLTLTAPLDYQVVQRESKGKGTIIIRGNLAEGQSPSAVIEARVQGGGKDGPWRTLPATVTGTTFAAPMAVPAGGWYRMEVRVLKDGNGIAKAEVQHVGIGEVFVVAGQSNSANHGEEKQSPQTGRVAAFDGQRWQLANDPQPGASGKGGSFLPPLGDALVRRFDVPVGFIACGIGATSVREWLPSGSRFSNPPTIERNVRKLSDGEWESKGDVFTHFIARMKQTGLHGFRAVLWHQGESDANQKDPTRTLSGPLYREYLVKLIRDSRREIGWDAPWFVAQASYHVPGDEASPEIRAAQASLWKDGIAQEGPDSDALKGDLRERGGKGVHFSGNGLRAHAAKWAEKIAAWLDRQLTVDSATKARKD